MSTNSVEAIDARQTLVQKKIELMPGGVLQYRRNYAKGEQLIEDQAATSIGYSAVSLVEVQDVYMWTDNNTICVYDKDMGIYESLSLSYKGYDFDKAEKVPVTHVSGKSAMFLHLASHNYYHWLLDTLPCLGVLDKAGVNVSSIDNIYIHRIDSAFQWSMLDRLGVDRDRVIFNGHGIKHYHFDRLLVPLFRLDGAGWPNPWMVSYLKQQFVPPVASGESNSDSSQPQKLYIARGEARRAVTNEAELIEKLELLGYKILHPHKVTFQEQVDALAKADFVLAPHGAGLANTVFCRPGSKVFEFGGHYISPHFRMLSEYNQLDYRAIAAGLDEQGQRLPISSLGSIRHLDFIADIEEIVQQAEVFSKEPSLPLELSA